MEPTPDHVRGAPVVGRGCYLAFGIQEKAMPAHARVTRRRQPVRATSGVLLTINAAHAAECHLTGACMPPDGHANGGATAVWSDQGSSSRFFIESLHVNADGTGRSYSVKDVWGDTSALNKLCNAMKDGCAGLSKDAVDTRRIVTQ
jgi:hypothetical protein